jgi:hypothetical protein
VNENRQFVVRVLDVAQGAGALVQVDDQPPRWLSTNDVLAVDVPKPDPSQDERRTIAAGWGRHVHTLWICPRCSVGHTITGDTWLDCGCGARYRFVYGDEPEADAPERWSGWSDEELDRLGQMLGDGGHELADLQAERCRRHAERQHCCAHSWDVVEYGGAPVALVCADCGAKRKVVGE